MKTFRSYTSLVKANKEKVSFITSILSDLNSVSNDIYDLLTLLNNSKNNLIFPKNEVKILYKFFRIKYPKIPSKILQNYIRFYQSKKIINRKLKAGIYLNQDFNVQFKNTKLTNTWLRFSKKNIPLFGSHLIRKIKDPSEIKQVQIYKKNKKIYTRLVVVKNIDLKPNSENIKSLSDVIVEGKIGSKINNFKRRNFYRGKEYRRLKDSIHKTTSEVVSNLLDKKIEVLLLEDEKTLKNCFMFSNSTIDIGFEYFPFKTFKNILIGKCLNAGISLRYTE